MIDVEFFVKECFFCTFHLSSVNGVRVIAHFIRGGFHLHVYGLLDFCLSNHGFCNAPGEVCLFIREVCDIRLVELCKMGQKGQQKKIHYSMLR
jgi:hypothetical protein